MSENILLKVTSPYSVLPVQPWFILKNKTKIDIIILLDDHD